MIVYVATNTANGHFYIGATKQSLRRRQSEHRNAAKHMATTKKRTCRAFYAAIHKYGWDTFAWSIMAQCSSLDELMVEEARLIKVHRPYYNISCGGYGGVRGLNEGQAELSLLQKPIRCLDDGAVYKSLSEAAKVCGIRVSDISSAMYRKGRAKGLQFEFVDPCHAKKRRPIQKASLTGVVFRADLNSTPWMAKITVNGKTHVLGRFSTEQEAHGAYLSAAIDLGSDGVTSKNNTSGFRGVHPHDTGWQAAAYFDGKRHYLGSYSSPEEARDAIAMARQSGVHSVKERIASKPGRNSRYSPLKGVELCGRRWRARWRKINLGMFDTAEEAHAVYLGAKAQAGAV